MPWWELLKKVLIVLSSNLLWYTGRCWDIVAGGEEGLEHAGAVPVAVGPGSVRGNPRTVLRALTGLVEMQGQTLKSYYKHFNKWERAKFQAKTR